MKLLFHKCKGPEAGGQDLFKEVNMAEEVCSGCSGHGHALPMWSENDLLLVAFKVCLSYRLRKPPCTRSHPPHNSTHPMANEEGVKVQLIWPQERHLQQAMNSPQLLEGLLTALLSCFS